MLSNRLVRTAPASTASSVWPRLYAHIPVSGRECPSYHTYNTPAGAHREVGLVFSLLFLQNPAGCINRLEIKDTEDPPPGLGCFAKDEISQGTVLGEYTGEVISDFEYWAKGRGCTTSSCAETTPFRQNCVGFLRSLGGSCLGCPRLGTPGEHMALGNKRLRGGWCPPRQALKEFGVAALMRGLAWLVLFACITARVLRPGGPCFRLASLGAGLNYLSTQESSGGVVSLPLFFVCTIQIDGIQTPRVPSTLMPSSRAASCASLTTTKRPNVRAVWWWADRGRKRLFFQALQTIPKGNQLLYVSPFQEGRAMSSSNLTVIELTRILKGAPKGAVEGQSMVQRVIHPAHQWWLIRNLRYLVENRDHKLSSGERINKNGVEYLGIWLEQGGPLPPPPPLRDKANIPSELTHWHVAKPLCTPKYHTHTCMCLWVKCVNWLHLRLQWLGKNEFLCLLSCI